MLYDFNKSLRENKKYGALNSSATLLYCLSGEWTWTINSSSSGHQVVDCKTNSVYQLENKLKIDWCSGEGQVKLQIKCSWESVGAWLGAQYSCIDLSQSLFEWSDISVDFTVSSWSHCRISQAQQRMYELGFKKYEGIEELQESKGKCARRRIEIFLDVCG